MSAANYDTADNFANETVDYGTAICATRYLPLQGSNTRLVSYATALPAKMAGAAGRWVPAPLGGDGDLCYYHAVPVPYRTSFGDKAKKLQAWLLLDSKWPG